MQRASFVNDMATAALLGTMYNLPDTLENEQNVIIIEYNNYVVIKQKANNTDQHNHFSLA